MFADTDKNKKIVIVSLILSIVLLMTTTISSHYLFEIKTYWWHLRNDSTVQWNNLQINVPNELVAKNYQDRVLVYKMSDATKAAIGFYKINKDIKDFSDLDSIYSKRNYDIIEKKVQKILGKEAYWISYYNNEKDSTYTEAVILLSDSLRISYIGEVGNRNYFDSILGSLKWTVNGGVPPRAGNR